jgi:hypothetical protein
MQLAIASQCVQLKRRLAPCKKRWKDRLQDFDMAKRHYGMVLTQYDPENEVGKREFKAIKAYQKDIAKLRAVCPSLLGCCLFVMLLMP